LSDPVLVLDRLGKDFAGKAALAELSCAVRPGEVVGLLGPNGAGKTTTMKLVLGLLKPTRGTATVHVGGVTLSCTHARRARGEGAPWLLARRTLVLRFLERTRDARLRSQRAWPPAE